MAGFTSLDECKILELPKVTDIRGNLSFIESGKHVPFEVKRVFYLYDVPTGANRGAHAHKALHQFLICLSGSFDVYLDNGVERKLVHLNRPWQGLHIPPMIWAAEVNFDPNSICLVLASAPYDEKDYYRDYQEYLTALFGPDQAEWPVQSPTPLFGASDLRPVHTDK